MNATDTAQGIIATIKVARTKFENYEQMLGVGKLDPYISRFLKNHCRDILLGEIPNTDEEEVVLYWSPEKSPIAMTKIEEYFKEIGFEVIKNTHPSLLINSMAQLTEEKLSEIGIPSDVKIILPTVKSSMIRYKSGNYCFLGTCRAKRPRKLALYSPPIYSNQNSAFLLKKRNE